MRVTASAGTRMASGSVRDRSLLKVIMSA